MDTVTITYRFKFPDRSDISYRIMLDSTTLDIIAPVNGPLPPWTALSHHQCPHCPLSSQQVEHCPLATRVAPVVALFQDVISYQAIGLEVVTAERVITQETTAQRAVSSLMGVIIACCGCLHTGYFKPMARFHLPLADKNETIYRCASMFLLAQYFRQQNDGNGTFSLNGLETMYRNMQTINIHLVKRLQQAGTADSNINAVILLDMFAMALPLVLNESLDAIRHLFAAYLTRPPGTILP